jgi:hypothetical protein
VQPALARDAADISRVLGAFAIFAAALGALELGALAVVWRAPRLAVGRTILLTSGLVMSVAGLLLLNGGTLQSPEIQWSAGPAIVGAAIVAIFIAVGLLACAAALFSDLPGAWIAVRMTSRPSAAWAR